jgi:hypothetical protein
VSRRTRALAAALLAAVMSAGAGTAYAWWRDDATATTGTFAAHTVSSQAAPTCTNVGGTLGLLGSVELSWLHVDGRYEYEWQAIRVSDGSVRGSGVVTPTGGAGSQVVLPIAMSLLDLGLPGVDLEVVIRARLDGATSWTATTSTTTPIHSVSLLVGLSLRCGAL